jgi:hypothetical protein
VLNNLRDKDLDIYCNTDNILCKSYIRFLECNNLENFKNEKMNGVLMLMPYLMVKSFVHINCLN